jgi:hypothetical protein
MPRSKRKSAREKVVQIVSDEELNQLLIETKDEPNEPDIVEREIVARRMTQVQRQELRVKMARHYCDGKSRAELRKIFAAEHGLSSGASDQLMKEVVSELQEESKERAGINKAASERRLLRHIQRASTVGQYAAVAKLEETLARVQGTLEPDRIEIGASQRLTDAILAVLGQQDPAEVRTLVAEGVEVIDVEAPKFAH